MSVVGNQTESNVFSDLIQLFTRWQLVVIGWQFQSESIAGITWKYMQVNMKNFLARSHAISEKEVHSFTLQARLAQRRHDLLCDAKYLRAFLRLQVCEIRRVPVRNN